ncbi:MAG: 3-hydroxyacyl-CoA dehydrogenase [Phenylobacterium sp.]|nr:3-hydroxyacyl-CoA dehydrogenase [Phenylobacterium sp.]
MSDHNSIRSVAVIGTGVIGASWSALFLAQGLDVVATDVAPKAEASLRAFVDAAWPALEGLGLAPGASRSRLRFEANLEEAVRGADLVQENGPERIEFKRELYAKLDELLPASTLIASSSSGLTMSEIQKACRQHPERCFIGHPFNPPHLIPLVELVGGAQTSEATIERAAAFYDGLGKKTVRLRKEVPGHVANRLAAALLREVMYLVDEDVISVGDIDAAVSYGPGLRWGVQGPMLLSPRGGGAGGIDHWFDQFTGPITAWWKVLGDPQITPQMRAKVTAGVMEEVAGRSIESLEAQRDRELMGLLKVRAAG